MVCVPSSVSEVLLGLVELLLGLVQFAPQGCRLGRGSVRAAPQLRNLYTEAGVE